MATPIPKNRAPFSLAELCLATGGAVACEGPGPLVGVATDSRNLGHGEVFVALRGEHFDGHDHVASAVEHGARALIVDRAVSGVTGVSIVQVADTLDALGALARYHRLRWERRGLDEPQRGVVGITGSAGKTTTRHAVARFLAAGGPRVFSSEGNLNNRVGVPMTLLGLEPAHDLAVVELGMNQPGEIAALANMVKPDVGVVTLVAEAHTEGVGSVWGVAREKAALLEGLPTAGAAVVNGDSDLTRATLARATAGRFVIYGECADADVRLVERHVRGLEGSDVRIAVRQGEELVEIEARVPLLGRAGALASLAATAVLLGLAPLSLSDFDLDLPARFAALSGNVAGRLTPKERADGTIVIDDAYNANPASMRSSIEVASEIASALERPLVLVLGPMFELGERSDELHEHVGRLAAAAKPRLVVVVASEAMAHSAEAAGAKVVRAPDAADAERIVLEQLVPRELCLIKASNSVGLGRVARRLMEVA